MSCGCGTTVQVWFLVESKNDITSAAPEIRILKRTEKLSSAVRINTNRYGNFAVLLDKAELAYRDELGAGAIVYLRKIFEMVTLNTAKEKGINTHTEKGKRRPFKELLDDVESNCHIVPEEFSNNGYKLFGELSDVIHGEFDEELGLKKFEPLYRLVIGILENVRNKREYKDAMKLLEWPEGGER